MPDGCGTATPAEGNGTGFAGATTQPLLAQDDRRRLGQFPARLSRVRTFDLTVCAVSARGTMADCQARWLPTAPPWCSAADARRGEHRPVGLQALGGTAAVGVEEAVRAGERAADGLLTDGVTVVLTALARGCAGIAMADDTHGVLRLTPRRVGARAVPVGRVVDTVADAAAVGVLAALAAVADAAVGRAVQCESVVGAEDGDGLRILAGDTRGALVGGDAFRAKVEKSLCVGRGGPVRTASAPTRRARASRRERMRAT